MAESGSRFGGWIAILILLFFLFTGLFWPILDNEPARVPHLATPSGASAVDLGKTVSIDSVNIVSWDWRDDRTGQTFAVWGVLRNVSNQHVNSVVLELRTEDANGQPLTRYPIISKNLPPGQEKPFRADVPRTGREAKGFLDVKRVTASRSSLAP
ncbi:MAG: DUF3426 domain-containing protein [bacterium]|nr:DUF3426 domain-containing protein [bacterium]